MAYTNDQRQRLAQLAGAMALEAPEREGKYSSDAKVPWVLIHKVRTIMDEAGVDWRKLHQEVSDEKQRRKAVAAERRK